MTSSRGRRRDRPGASRPAQGLRAALVGACLTLAACGQDAAEPPDGGGGLQPPASALFSGQFETIEVEVDYMAGAEPFTGSAGALGDLWQIFGDNAARLFEGTGSVVKFPSNINEMEEVDVAPAESFTASAILAIAQDHRDLLNTPERATFYALWLDGFFKDNEGAVRQDVLGVSIGDTGVIAMFKPVIESASSPRFDGVARFVEQTTLVHEFGHAAGLVNRGVPLTSDHHDAEHGAHCDDDRCVMFFANEGVADLRDFVLDFVVNGDTVVFGDECLADARALIDAAR